MALKHTRLFKKLVCEFAYKWVTVLSVAVNKVDKRATVRVLRVSVKIMKRKLCLPVPFAASTQTLIIRIRNLHSLTHTSSRLRVRPLSSVRTSGSNDTVACEDRAS
jgi:hypothetical protein